MTGSRRGVRCREKPPVSADPILFSGLKRCASNCSSLGFSPASGPRRPGASPRRQTQAFGSFHKRKTQYVVICGTEKLRHAKGNVKTFFFVFSINNLWEYFLKLLEYETVVGKIVATHVRPMHIGTHFSSAKPDGKIRVCIDSFSLTRQTWHSKCSENIHGAPPAHCC